MNPTFGEAARRLSGLSAILFGWRPEDFWRATPAEFAALIDAMRGPAPAQADAADLARLKEMFPDG